MSNPYDPATVRALADILVHAGLTELEIEGKDGRVRLIRGATQVIAAAPVAAPVAMPAPAPAPIPQEDAGRHPGAVLSPMVGVAYLAPEPGATPFIAVGSQVSAGQTLLLIEAMKTFNQIKAPRAGTVTRIFVTPGSPVEYDEPLLILE